MKTKKQENKSKKPSLVDLKVKIDDEEYILGTLSFNLNKDEMSWHYNDCFKDKQLNLNTGEYTSPIDHTTMHSEICHTRYLHNKSTCKSKPICQISKSFLPSIGEYKLCMVEQFFLNGSDRHCLSKTSKFTNATSQLVAAFSKPIDFSLVMFLIPRDFPTDYFVENHFFSQNNKEVRLSCFKSSNYPIGRIVCFKKFDLLTYVMPVTQDISKIDSEKIPLGPVRLIDYQRPLNSIYHIFDEK